ncbi:MAG: hypothetical protein JWP87_5267 [Labilithrix sp.]|nr:hypothetical protein [Labilithrix sp.]
MHEAFADMHRESAGREASSPSQAFQHVVRSGAARAAGGSGASGQPPSIGDAGAPEVVVVPLGKIPVGSPGEAGPPKPATPVSLPVVVVTCEGSSAGF